MRPKESAAPRVFPRPDFLRLKARDVLRRNGEGVYPSTPAHELIAAIATGPSGGATRMMDVFAALESTAFATWLRESPSIWAYPAILTLHTAGLAVLVGPSWALDLRLLGFAPAIPLRAPEKAFPVMWIGFWVNGISGLLLFAADATTKGATLLFATKLALIAIAVVNIFAIRQVVYRRVGGTEPVSGPMAKALAVASIALWIAAIGTGRWMAYV
jgi:hypothetical protein